MKHKGDIDLGGNDINNAGNVDASVGALNDVTIATPLTGQVIKWNGTAWVNANEDDESISTLADVALAGPPASGELLYFDGSDWTNQKPNVEELANVTVTTPAIGQHLEWNGTAWVNATPAPDTDTHLGNANLTANASRTYSVDGNELAIDLGSGDFVVKDGVTNRIYADGFGDVQLHGLTYPSTDGTNGQVMTTNGAGTLSFTTVSGGGGTPLASADQTLTANRTIDTNGFNLDIELDGTGTADTFTVHDGTNDLFEVNTNTSGELFSVNDVSGLTTFASNDDGSAVLPKILTAAPTGTPPEGTMQLAIVAGTAYLYVYINAAWRKTTLA